MISRNATPSSDSIPKLINREGQVIRKQSGPSLGLKLNTIAIEHHQVINKAMRRLKQDGGQVRRIVVISEIELRIYVEHWRNGASCFRVKRDRRGRWHAHRLKQQGRPHRRR